MVRLFLVGLVVLLLAGCAQTTPTPTPVPVAPTEAIGSTSVPITESPIPNEDYPAPDEVYPAPTEEISTGYPTPRPQGPAFTINGPISASDTQVTGTGPAGVPIRVVNLTRSGELIAETRIGDDGTFTVDAKAGSFNAAERVALMLGAGASQDDFLSGPGYEDIPLVGVVFASVLVE